MEIEQEVNRVREKGEMSCRDSVIQAEKKSCIGRMKIAGARAEKECQKAGR